MAVTKPYVSTRKRVKAAAEAKKPLSPVVAKKRGRPVGSKTKDPLVKAYESSKHVDWEALAKKLQRALAAEIKHGDAMEYEVSVLREHIHNLENRSWLSRTFNLKG